MSNLYDVIIIGGGIAGYSAALYSKRFNLKTLVVTEEKKGILQYSPVVENYPGIEAKSGLEIMEIMEKQATAIGGELKVEKVKKIQKEKNIFRVMTEHGEYFGKTIIIATGLERKKLGIPGEKEFEGKGISFCATCDAALFKNKIVAVVGGSDSAAKEALLLSEYAKKVYIIYRKEMIRAEPIIIEKINKKVKENKIEMLRNTNIVEIKGKKFMTHVILNREYKGSRELKLDGLFIEIGGVPGNILAKDLGVKLDEDGYIIVDKESKTNVPGVFAAGDVTNNKWKQAIIAAAQGSFAAHSAYEYIKQGKNET